MTTDNEQRDKEIFEAYMSDWREHGEPRWDRIADSIPHIELSQRRLRAIAREQFKQRGHKDEVVAEKNNEMSDAVASPQFDGTVSFRVDGDTAIALSNNPQIKTLEELLEAGKVDLDVWEVKDWVLNAWGMGRKNEQKHLTWENGTIVDGQIDDTGGWSHLQNFQVKVWLKPRKIRPIEIVLNELTETLANAAPKYVGLPLSAEVDEPEHLFVPSLFDAHFNKRTGIETLAQAVKVYKKTVDKLIQKAIRMNATIDHVLYVVGQDMLNADSLKDMTTAGTWVDSMDDIRTAVDAVCEVSIYAVEQFASLANTTVMVVPGNHDRYGIFWLGKVLEARFTNHDGVVVLNGTNPRKYFQYHKVLIGVDHGDKVAPKDLALTMAAEAPKAWAATEHREFLRGHLHKRTEMYYPMTTEKGVNVRIMPALCPPDQWHILHGFIGNKRYAEGLLFHKENGPAGTFPVFVDEL